MLLKKLHHVAYRCNDALETKEFYTKVLGLKNPITITNKEVPSTKEPFPHLHIFFAMEDGSLIAFFELPDSPEMQFDANTPRWVQHLALEVADEKALLEAKEQLEENGIDVLGPIDHSFCKSIYFFDPSGHRLELSCNSGTQEMLQRLDDAKDFVLDEWMRTKQHVQLTDWVHSN